MAEMGHNEVVTNCNRLAQEIIHALVVVLTGAGASRPLGFLLDDELYKEFKATPRPFVDDLIDRSSQRSAGSMADLMEILDHELRCQDPNSREWYAANQVKQAALEFVVMRFTQVDPGVAWRLYEPLWKSLRDGLRDTAVGLTVVPVFTTNYDRSLEFSASGENAFIRTHTGFIHNNTGLMYESSSWHNLDLGWSQQEYLDALRFDPKRSDPPCEPVQINVPIFKLHGSVDWLTNADEKPMVQRINLRGFNPANMQTATLYLGRASSRPTEQPFNDAYDYLECCLANCKLLIIVGNGLADKAVRNAIKEGISDNASLSIHIVDVVVGSVRKVLLKELGFSGEITGSKPICGRLFGKCVIKAVKKSVARATEEHPMSMPDWFRGALRSRFGFG